MQEGLLEQAYGIVRENTRKQPYNIFSVLEIEDKEVMLCRVLADLLNPAGMHGRGSAYLKEFLSTVLCREDADEICKNARVYKEYPITGGRRIDIVIVSETVFIPVEVKVNAEEQPSQCYVYHTYAKKKDAGAKVVYLTLFGTEPSRYSLDGPDGAEGINADDCICISFSSDIMRWLELVLLQETEPAMVAVLEQFKETVEKLTTLSEEGVCMELVDKIMESENNFRGMLAISDAADTAKARLIWGFFEELEGVMDAAAKELHLEKEAAFRWYDYREEAVEEFYKHAASTYPGINYVFRDVRLPGGAQLWLRIEVDYTLYFGVCLFDASAEGEEMDEPAEEVKEALKEYVCGVPDVMESWWVKTWYLPTGTEQENAERDRVPDFKMMNEAAVRLSDAEKRKEFVAECVEVVKIKLNEFMKIKE